jgi:hypothetical protein
VGGSYVDLPVHPDCRIMTRYPSAEHLVSRRHFARGAGCAHDELLRACSNADECHEVP